MNPDLKKAQELVENIQIAEYFEFMKSKVGNNEMLARLQKTFILGKTDVDFYDQLKTLAQMLLDSDNQENTNSSDSKTQIIQKADKIYNIEKIDNANFS